MTNKELELLQNELSGCRNCFFIRPYYYTVLPFLKFEEQVDTMGVFRIRKNNDPRLLKEFISVYNNLLGFLIIKVE